MRSGKYEKWLEPDNLAAVTGWARAGLTEAEIAHNMGCALSTLKEWKNRFQEIREALANGKEVADFVVENALYKKCLGYTVQLQRTFKLKVVDYDPETGKKIREREALAPGIEEIHVPADTVAQMFWLKNRKPAVWRDKPDTSSEEILAKLDAVIGGIDRAAAQ